MSRSPFTASMIMQCEKCSRKIFCLANGRVIKLYALHNARSVQFAYRQTEGNTPEQSIFMVRLMVYVYKSVEQISGIHCTLPPFLSVIFRSFAKDEYKHGFRLKLNHEIKLFVFLTFKVY